MCLLSSEIDAIASVREIDLQYTPILEAKYAPASHTWEKELLWARAGTGLLRSSCDSPDIAKGELAQLTDPGKILFPVICVGLL